MGAITLAEYKETCREVRLGIGCIVVSEREGIIC